MKSRAKPVLNISIAALCIAFSACSRQHAVIAMGPAPITDSSVTPFDAQRATLWPDFRLGGGLNVVVVSRVLPRETNWRFQAGKAKGGISSSPVVYRNLVLVAANDHNLYAIDAASGTLRWRYHDRDELMTQPVYKNGLVIVASGNAACFVCFYPTYVIGGSGYNSISAIQLTSGLVRWQRRLAGTGMPTPALVGEDVVHDDGSGAVLAFDARTGHPQWAVVLPSTFAMSAVVHDGGRLYVSGVFTAGVYALRTRDGALIWRRLFSKYDQGTGDGPLAVSGNVLVTQYLQPLAPHAAWGWMVSAGSRVLHHIVALDKRSGQVLWDRVVDRGVSPVANQSAIPLIYRRRLYEGSADAAVMTCLDVASGRILWQLHTYGPVKGGIVALNGLVYFGDLGGYLWAVDARTGQLVGRLRTNLRFNVGSPVILNNSLIDGSEEGTIVAVPLSDIRQSQHDR